MSRPEYFLKGRVYSIWKWTILHESTHLSSPYVSVSTQVRCTGAVPELFGFCPRTVYIVFPGLKQLDRKRTASITSVSYNNNNNNNKARDMQIGSLLSINNHH